MTYALCFLAGLLVAGVFALQQRRRVRESRIHEDTFRSMLDTSTDVFYRTDAQGRLIMISPSALQLMAFDSMDDVLHKPMDSFWAHPAQRAAMLETIASQGAVRDYEVLLRKRDGGAVVVAVSCSFYRDGRGRVLGVEGMFRDITDRKKAEAALQEAERKYRELFELAPVAIFQATLEGQFLTVNPEYARMVGYASPREMVECVDDIACQLYADSAERVRYVAHLREQGKVDNFEVQLKRRDGQQFWASITTRIRRGEDGGVAFIYGFIVDITRQKEEAAFRARMHEALEQQVVERTMELEHSNRRLRELDQLKTSFLSSASHELRTPLTSILGFAKITAKTFDRFLQGVPGVDAAQRAKADTIRANLGIIAKEGLRLTRLVNDLLDVNRIEAGAVEWRLEALEVAPLLEEASLAVAGELTQRPQLTLRTIVEPGLSPLLVDRDRMHQVLLNLLHNAVKFTAFGEIRLLARSIPEAPGMAELVVEDDGPGIPAAELELVFEKFYQSRTGAQDTLPPAHMTAAKGAGLGLAICRQIVEHLGGSIRAESPAGEGARFILRLPVAPLQEPLVAPQ
ncbi:sensor histidine kinase [Megalodesulfovibrio gigas]|uniref:histidine kinase n=1 Tax=Megalodesulfovibrio gigas (strain ATCC 19364 / DSM 1382 / NCIMB 9332 / VKM B-1759) TaxID=1121448 RepID=T2G7H9_MEGG1|nr:PAS domain-containing sensor histidine kinase [Megalodesulfovibrio gigas]AGW12144.1 putative multi-sensor signal transduction histidine kinase [Megalodesulfovibrio gigas DSM 1382 = ATCC 19364]